MDRSTICDALGELLLKLEKTRDAKKQIESGYTGARIQGGFYEFPEAAFEAYLHETYNTVVILLEAAALPETRRALVERWRQFCEEGVGHTDYLEKYDYLKSEPFEYLSNLIDGLRISAGEGVNTLEAYELGKLEAILRRTAVLLRGRDIQPKREQDIQQVMHDYLNAFFPEYKHPITIPGTVQDFKPDGGIRNLRAAIEFKFATSKEQVAKAVRGIFEDVSGYSGSLDWTRFYSVIYQTEPFESEERVRTDVSRTRALTWTPILVTGAAHRRRLKKGPRARR